MFVHPGLIGGGAGLLFIGSNSSTTNATSYNFGSFTVGDGLMIVCVAGAASSTGLVSTVSIGGTNGTLISSTSNLVPAVIAYRAVTGGSANVTVTFSGTMVNAFVAVYLLTGNASSTPTDSDFNPQGVNNTSTVNLDIAAAGSAVFVSVLAGTGGSTWVGPTENVDTVVESISYSASSVQSVTAQPGYTATVNWLSSSINNLIGASWA